MAKELPFFKFEPGLWDNGRIQMCSFEAQGVFINLCSMYWHRLGDVPYKLALQKICKGNATALQSLCDEGVVKLIDGMICIDFLNEQLSEFENTSKTNSESARIRWEKHRKNAVALQPKSERNAIRGEKIREERDTVTHGKGKLYITVRRVFANDPVHKIFDLWEYFIHTQQLETMQEKGWVYFKEFINENAGKIFNEPDHLYNSFKNFCIAYRPAPVVEKFKEEAFNKSLWTLEAWEQQYDWQLKSNNEFRKHFGYAEL